MTNGNSNNTQAENMDWDDTIANDGPDFITLPGGEYPFKIVSVERALHEPNPQNPGKLPACKKAVVTIDVDGGELGVATLRENLFLNRSVEGILCSFFTSIGLRKHGEPLKMPWQQVPGSVGRCKIKIRKYTKDGEEREINQIDRWLEPTTPAVSAPPASMPTPAQQAAPNYTPGAF